MSFIFKFMIFFIILILYTIVSYNRNHIWKDDFTLWSDAVMKSPNKARPNYELGRAYSDYNDFDSAYHYMKRATELDPAFVSKWLIKK